MNPVGGSIGQFCYTLHDDKALIAQYAQRSTRMEVQSLEACPPFLMPRERIPPTYKHLPGGGKLTLPQMPMAAITSSREARTD